MYCLFLRKGKMDKVISDLILDLHRGSTSVPLSEFKRWAFEQIQTVLSFDSAVWVNGHVQNKKMVSDDVYSYNQPEELYELREQYEEYSMLLNRMMVESGITLTREMVLPHGNFRDLKIYKEYFSKYDMEFALSTVKYRRQTGLYSYVALYRAANGQVFNEEERRKKEALLLHVFESYKYCLFHHYIGKKCVDAREIGKLIIDRNGVIREMCDEVMSQLHAQWPSWSGPYAPRELIELPSNGKIRFEKLYARVHSSDEQLIGIEIYPM